MKHILLIFLFALSACSNTKESNKPMVAVSILPQKYFVEHIAGNLVDVMVLVEPGSSPELYSLRPTQMAQLAKAAAWFGMGKIEFEQGWKNKILESNPSLQFTDCSAKANWIVQEAQDHGDHQHMHGVDPHIWSSPQEALKIAEISYLALKKLLPNQTETLSKNYEALKLRINEVDQELLKICAAENGQTSFLTFHPALAYLARDYNLNQIAIEFEGKEPSPAHLKRFVEIAREKELSCILVQKEFNKSAAQQVAKEIDAEVVEIDPLSENWDTELIRIMSLISKGTN